jgi:hypothetical protein
LVEQAAKPASEVLQHLSYGGFAVGITHFIEPAHAQAHQGAQAAAALGFLQRGAQALFQQGLGTAGGGP